ncbi:MAG TPA: MarR family winged helix-turn-helix transcriptional regulator [Candidatus Agathobaculum intestinipullorum]|nr:MarR family winged helix-turn-helix transcriptional regulator [Candidatus Agathobaculum intestinipullorum]
MLDTLAYHVTILSRSFSAYTGRVLDQLGLSQGLLYPVLYIGRHPGCTQAELTEALGLDWGYCQRSVIRLTEDGFLTREKHGRAYRLSLSEKGKQAFEASHQVFFDWDADTLNVLDQTERAQLLALLRKIKPKEANTKLCTRR